MNDRIEVLRELNELEEAARLLGATQAKRLFGCYTDEDSRFELAMRRSIAKHRRAIENARPAIIHCDNCGCDWLDNGLNPIGCPYCEQIKELRGALEECHALSVERWRQLLATEAENQRLKAEVKRLQGGTNV